MPDGDGDGDRKSEPGEEEEEPVTRKKPAANRGRAKAKAKPAARANAKAAAKAKAKATAKAKAKAEAKATAKAEAAAKADPKAKAKTSRKSVANADGDTGAKSKGKGPAATFAKRWKPDKEEAAARFLAIKDVFMSHIAPKLQGQSSFQEIVFVGGWDRTNPKHFAPMCFPNMSQCFPNVDHKCSACQSLAFAALQDGWFTLCTRLFRGSDAIGYPEYVALATEKVTEFLNMESVRILFFCKDNFSQTVWPH